jgi:ferredoxin like protein
MIIEDKLKRTRIIVDMVPHITINLDICRDCAEKPCLYVCPVQNYEIKDGELTFDWQGCIECSACRIACPKGAISWDYPRGGFGVSLRYG